MRASAPSFDLHGVLSRQVDLHVHIAQVDQGENLAAAAQHLALLGQPVEDATLDGGAEGSCR